MGWFWIIIAVAFLITAVIFHSYAYIKELPDKKPALHLYLCSVISLVMEIILYALGLITIDVRFNPSSGDSSYTINNNDCISLASDFSIPFILPIYYTIDGSYVYDAEELVKYTDKIYIRNLDTDDQVTIHAGLSLFGLTHCFADSVYTYNINREKKEYHINVETIKVTVNALKENNYTIPLYVSLENNAGFSSNEWGITVDKRCAFSVDTDNNELTFYSYTDNYEINSTNNELYTNGFGNSKTGKMLCLLITLPEDANVGDFYPVTYMSEHSIWWFNVKSKINNKEISCKDGGIIVTDETPWKSGGNGIFVVE